MSCVTLCLVGTLGEMADVLLKDRIKEWKGKRSLKECAAALDIDYPSMRKYATGKRTPSKLALAELERRMAQTEDMR